MARLTCLSLGATRRSVLPVNVLAITLTFGLLSSAQNCYWPNGAVADGYVPCRPDQPNSMCCGGGGYSACLSNGLCLWMDDLSVDRGACTAKDWDSAKECIKTCQNAPVNGHADVTPCVNTTQPTYCCGKNNDCCNGTAGITANGVYTGMLYDVFMPPAAVSSSSTLSASSTASTASSSTPTSAAAATTCSASSTPVAASCDKVTIGAGVGASLGAALLVVCGILAWEVSRRKKLEAQYQNQSQGHFQGHYAGPPGYATRAHEVYTPQVINEMDASK